jgi:hypothetical protein
MHILAMLGQKVFILPVISGDQMAAFRAAALAPHGKLRIRFDERVVVANFFIFAKIPERHEITLRIKPAIAFAGVI